MSPATSGNGTNIDPITVEVLSSAFRAICDEASALLAKGAYGTTISEGHDHSGSLLTREGRLVAHGRRDQAAHLGTFEESIKTTIEHAGGFREGDVFVFNDPYHGGTHQPDVKVIRPVFVDGSLFAFTISCGHWADVGGPIPGSFNPLARECFAEGLRIPPMLLVDQGRPVRSTFEIIKANVRVPDERMADLHAQQRAAELMERRLLEYVGQFGAEVVEHTMYALMDRSETLLREGIRELPDGTYEFEDFGDCDVLHPDKPRIRVHVSMTIAGDQVTFDFSKSDPAPISPFGFARPALLSSVYDGTMHCFPHLVPLNHGITRSIEVVSVPGSCVDVLPPTPVLGFASGAYEKVAAAVMACWAQAFATVDPSRMHAATVNLANLALSGNHPETGVPFVSYLWNEGGQGARSYKDGNSFQLMIFIGGATNQPIEVLERLNAIRALSCEAVGASAGHGTYRGGFGIDRSFEATGDMILTMHGDRAEVTPFGLAGGCNGGGNVLVLNPGTDSERWLGMHAVGEQIRQGDVLRYSSNGGGGFGPPRERAPEAVAHDVSEGYFGPDLAAAIYGVVLTETESGYEVDEQATAELRANGMTELSVGYGPGEVHPMGRDVVPHPT